MRVTIGGVNVLRAALLGLAGGALVIGWSARQRGRIARLPHPAPPAPASPAAKRLAATVTALAGELGERNLFKPRAFARAADYVEGDLRRAGYAPRSQEYVVGTEGVSNVRTRNVEAVVPADRAGAPVLIVGAHYDSAPGTPGADDNASGVAALLELARRFRGKGGDVELRFVAFSTEEPPFFGTAEMGSARYAAALAGEKRQAIGMISLEMLGYYSEQHRSQFYPPPLGLLYPSRGDYIGMVANWSSRRFLVALKRGFAPPRGTPLVAAALPRIIPEINLSDQLYFWKRGWPAVMVTDTAFLRNPHYHQKTDTPEKLDYERMADVVDGLEAALRQLVAKSRSPASPKPGTM